MNFLECARCGEVALIDENQSVEFDGDAHELCVTCWEDLRRWFLQINDGQFVNACA